MAPRALRGQLREPGPVRVGDVEQSRTRTAVRLALESEPSAVERPDGLAGRSPGPVTIADGRAGARVGSVDVAVLGIGDQAVPGGPERRWARCVCEPTTTAATAARSRPTSRSPSPIVAQRDPRREDRLTGDVNHGEPPFEEGPGRPLARASGQPEEVVEVVGRPRRPRARRGAPAAAARSVRSASCELPSRDRRCRRLVDRDRRRASPRANDGGATSRSPAGCPGSPPLRASASRGSSA